MGLVQEFKEFALKGNVVDMAVGVVIGGAFGKIIGSLVKDVILPAVGVLTGGVEFSDLKYVIQKAVPAVEASGGTEAVKAVEEVAIRYGLFIDSTINFAIIAAAIFCAIKVMNSMKKKEEEAPKEPEKPSDDIVLLREIRDSLAK